MSYKDKLTLTKERAGAFTVADVFSFARTLFADNAELDPNYLCNNLFSFIM